MFHRELRKIIKLVKKSKNRRFWPILKTRYCSLDSQDTGTKVGLEMKYYVYQPCPNYAFWGVFCLRI
jgi:hypothetical protein